MCVTINEKSMVTWHCTYSQTILIKINQFHWCSSQFLSSMSKNNQDTKKKQDKEFGTLTAVPDGFTMCLSPNGEECVVPQYLILALDHAFVAFHKKVDLEVLKVKPQVSFSTIGTMSFATPRHCCSCHSMPCLSTTVFIPCFPRSSFLWQMSQVKNNPYSMLGGELMFPLDPVRKFSSG